MFSKSLVTLAGLALSLAAVAADRTLKVELVDQSFTFAFPLRLQDGRILAQDWFSYSLKFTNASDEYLQIPVRKITVDFGRDGTCPAVSEDPIETITVAPGESAETGRIYCGGLSFDGDVTNSGVAVISAKGGESGRAVEARLTIRTK